MYAGSELCNKTRRNEKPAHKQWFEKKRHVCAEKRKKKILAEDGGGKKQATYAAVAPQHPTQAICRCNQLREEENKAEKHTAYIVFWFFTNTLRTVMGDEPL